MGRKQFLKMCMLFKVDNTIGFKMIITFKTI